MQELISRKVRSLLEDEAVSRAVIFSYLLVPVFLVYGFVSFDFIQRFDSTATLINNIWPRILLNSLPMLALGYLIKKSSRSSSSKIKIWSFVFFSIFHIGAWIYIWPIALRGHGEIINYASAANIYLIALAYAVIAPPWPTLVYFSLSLLFVFLLPLWVVTYESGDLVTFGLVLNDSLITMISGIIISRSFESLRAKIFIATLDKQEEARQFLGPELGRAIFENREELLSNKYKKGFIACLDIRNSTELTKKYGSKWLEFRLAYFELVSQCAMKYHGYIQKTVGDSHIINWGVMDDVAYLDDIPGLEYENRLAEEKRLKYASDNLFKALDEIFSGFMRLSNTYFPKEIVRLGGGVDKGLVYRAVQGTATRKELDFNGDPVNCSSRLQEFSKLIASEFSPESSLLAVSPFACDFIDNFQVYSRIETQLSRIRDYPNIKWILVREFKSDAVANFRKTSRAS